MFGLRVWSAAIGTLLCLFSGPGATAAVSDWRSDAEQNPYLREYFEKEYLSGRIPLPAEVEQLSRRPRAMGAQGRTTTQEGPPTIERMGRNGTRGPIRSEPVGAFVAGQIRKLVESVDRDLKALRTAYREAALARQEHPGRGTREQKRKLRSHLKEVASRAKSLRGTLRRIYPDLSHRETFDLPLEGESRDRAYAPEWDRLGVHVERATSEVQTTLAGLTPVRVSDLDRNMLILLGRVQVTARFLSSRL